MNLRRGAAAAVSRALGSRAVEAVFGARHRRDVRILALHDVRSAGAFEVLAAHIADRYRPVSVDDVIAARAGDADLPERAVVVTFDDGHPSVVEVGLPILLRHGVPATVFVCPGLIDDGRPGWWEEVAGAGRVDEGAEVDGRHLSGVDLVRALKQVPDAERRAVVERLRPHAGPVSPALTEAQLERWVDAGMGIGNHTWDHPCLDHCTPAEQHEQLARADGWLRERWGDRVRAAAYPNGDHTPEAEASLGRLGYELGLLFDHRVADLDQAPLRTSRLRLDADAPLHRVRAVVGGAHADVFHAGTRAARTMRRTS